jgi:PGF-pre-PGF domain-containing protein
VKPQHGIAVVLLIALVAGAAAAGGTPPTLPHVFYGNVTIGGAPAPAGTVITAMFGDTNCGSIMVTDAGRYGDPDWRLGNRLLVTGTADQNGETITFLVGGAAAKETALFTPGVVTRLDLSFEETMTVPVARFTANITSGPAPLTVAFTDTSTGADSRSWDFGDGTTSADQSPTHTYTTPGTYTANLTVANAAGSSSTTATITVLDEGAVEIIRGPYLTGTTTTATVVNWMAQEPVAGTVEYADDTYYTVNGGYEKSVAGTAETAFHHITLEGLAPDTLYHYRVAAGSTTTGDHTFRTFPGDGGFTFVVYGDTQRPANINLVADRIADENPLFVLHTGDQVNGVESAGEWNDFFRYSGRMLGNTTIYTTMGNHEKNHTAYYENFGLPQRYSFTCSDAQFAVLDDNNWVDLNRESAWLKDDLDSDAAWKFVAHHHPPYSSTPERSGGWILLRVWGETMKNAGVSAVFNGHVHAYERYVVGGINYVVAGTGAGPLYQLGDERPEGYQTSLEDTLGYTKVTLYPNGTAVAGFVKVARLSDDANVLEVYPPGSVFETYTMTRPPRADLAAVGLAVPGGATAGTACTVTGTIKNVGDAASRACSATLTAGDRGIGTAAVDALGPGETAEVSFTWTPAAAGEATLTLAVDPAAEIPDVDRTNNARTVTVTVAGSGPGPAPVANFSTNVTEGDAPLTVAFTDESTGAATWSWDFGDGNTSTEQHPAHTYATAGTYTVTLTVANAAGSSSATKTVTVTVPVGSIAVTSAPAGAAIWLDGENTGKFTSATLTEIPAGEHVVTLKLDGYADASMPVTVKPGKTASVHLTLTTRTGSLAVTSTPAGAGVFIDGADTGAVTNTTINGIGVGSHTVTLRKDGYVDASAEVAIVENEAATLHLNLDEVVAAPVAAFTANVTSGDAPLTVAFTDTSAGNPTAWFWTFGDGNTSTDRNPVHTYATAGTYTVTLAVANAAGSSSATKTVTVTAAGGGEVPPTLPHEFYGNVTIGGAPAPAGTVIAAMIGDTNCGSIRVVDAGRYGDPDWHLGHRLLVKGTSDQKGATIAFFANGAAAKETAAFTPGAATRLDLTFDEVVTAPVAAFTANVTSGDAPLTVAFTDESTGAATWSWDFGDGNTSTDRNPVHTYEDPGTYTVTLTVTNAAGSSSATKTVTVTVPVGSIAVTSAPAGAAIWLDGENTGKFTSATLTSIPAGEHVVTLKLDGYADASMPVIVEAGKTASVHLDLTTLTGSLSVTSVPAGARVFIDGADTGAVTNTTIDGIGIGTHTVTLRKDGYVDAAAEVTIEEAKTATLHLDLVEVVAAPVAVFTANVTSGDAPLIIAFTDASTGADSWSWAFGDGNTSTDRNPVHTYVTPGTYTVNLTVTNTAGSSSATKTVTVTEPSGPAPVAGFTADVTSGNVPLAVRFTDTSTGADSWSWSFGDGATSTEQNPVHTYTQVGRFTVTLTVANTGGSSSATGVVTTRDVPPAPKAEENFTLNSDAVNVTTGAGGQQVTINATAGLNVTGNDIHLQTGGLTVTIKTEGLIDNASTGNVTGNVTGVHLESTPVNATVGSAGNISVSFTAEMDNYDPALGITTTIYDQPGDATKTAFALAAQDEGSEIAGIAYAVYFNKSTPTDTIRDAVLRLTVSPGWVAANGGIKAIKIFRLGDDGNRSVLETTYEGMENGMMVFTAVSPEGFSAFALGAVAAPAPAPAPSRSSGGSSQASVGAASNLKLGDRVTFPMDRTAITAITLTADGDVKEVVVTVEKGSLPRDTEAPAGTVYQYIETNLHKAAAGNFSALQIQFAVPTAWLAAQGCTGSQVGLFRHTTDGWREIQVEVLGEEGGDAIFSAGADAFGLFAITVTGKATGEPTSGPTGTTTTPVAGMTTPPAEPPVEGPPAEGLPVTTLAFVAVAIVIIAAAGYVFFTRK